MKVNISLEVEAKVKDHKSSKATKEQLDALKDRFTSTLQKEPFRWFNDKDFEDVTAVVNVEFRE